MRFNLQYCARTRILIRPMWMTCFLVASGIMFSQHLSIGTGIPAASAIVDIQSVDKGILVPGMTTAERLMIASPATGLLVFDITTSSFWFHNALDWMELPGHWAQNGDHIFHPNPGNVGIGLTNPAFPLDVAGTIRSERPGSSPDGSFISFSSPTNDPGILLGRGNGTGSLQRRWDLKIDNDQSFRVRDNTAGMLRMQIDTAGRIGIGTSAPSSASALEINSTTKGFLPPRMSEEEREAIGLPTEGLMIWCNDCGVYGQLQVYNGMFWADLEGNPPAGLEVGDNYQGGIVAYIFQPGDPGYVASETHGIIAAASDLPESEWGCAGTDIPGADGLNLGTGSQNTIDIVAACTQPDIAAKRCSDLVLEGFSDWFLPSISELDLLYTNREVIGGFVDDAYWASTEWTDNNLAFTLQFQTGTVFGHARASLRHVRAIRYF